MKDDHLILSMSHYTFGIIKILTRGIITRKFAFGKNTHDIFGSSKKLNDANKPKLK